MDAGKKITLQRCVIQIHGNCGEVQIPWKNTTRSKLNLWKNNVRLGSGNAFYGSIQNLLFSRLLSENIKLNDTELWFHLCCVGENRGHGFKVIIGVFWDVSPYSFPDITLGTKVFWEHATTLLKMKERTQKRVEYLIRRMRMWSASSWLLKNVKWSRYGSSLAQRVGRGIVLLFHDRGTRRGWVDSRTPRPHFSLGKDPVPILQEAGWAPGPVWTGGKSRPHGDSIPDRPARSQSLCRLSYLAHSSWLLVVKR